MIERDSLEEYTEEEIVEWLNEDNQTLVDIIDPRLKKGVELKAQGYGRSVTYMIKYALLFQHVRLLKSNIKIPPLTYTDSASIKSFYDFMELPETNYYSLE